MKNPEKIIASAAGTVSSQQSKRGKLHGNAETEATAPDAVENTSIPDSASVFARLRNAQLTELAHEWFDDFRKRASHSSWALQYRDAKRAAEAKQREAGGSRKRKARDAKESLTDEQLKDLQLRCRFVSAVNDLQKSGAIKCRRVDAGNIEITRQMFTWF